MALLGPWTVRPVTNASDDPLPLADVPAEGRQRVTCRLCGRPLYGREARLWSLGDDCRAKLGLRTGRRPGGFEVEQDGLFGG
jgi:hypothetical protein